MKDPERIDNILDRIRVIWEESPDLRLGQLLVNVAGEQFEFNLYNYEDRDLQIALAEWEQKQT
jgi:uncharacterized protein YihD (DUF1040 family)